MKADLICPECKITFHEEVPVSTTTVDIVDMECLRGECDYSGMEVLDTYGV